MIASLRGTIVDKKNVGVEVVVNGVGYEVKGRIKAVVGEEVVLYTHMAVSENDISLYGFEKREELAVFKMLITVSGVGPKTAICVLADNNGNRVRKAVADADVKFFENIKGIGKKTAQRIIIDLKSKIGGLGELDLTEEKVIEDDVYLGLKQLGFDKSEIEKVMAKMPKELIETGEKIEWCLNNLG